MSTEAQLVMLETAKHLVGVIGEIRLLASLVAFLLVLVVGQLDRLATDRQETRWSTIMAAVAYLATLLLISWPS